MPRVKELIPTDKSKAVIDYCLSYKGWDDLRTEKELNIGRSARLARQKDTSRYSIAEIRQIIHGVPLSPYQISTLLGGIIWDCSGEQMQLRGGLK